MNETNTITAADFQKLQLKSHLTDNLLEQRSLQERLTHLQAQEKLILSKIQEIDTFIETPKAPADGTIAEGAKTVVTLQEGDIDPDTGALKIPQSPKSTHEVSAKGQRSRKTK